VPPLCALLGAWDANEGTALAPAIEALRTALILRTSRPLRQTGARQPRQGTEHQQVLAPLRRPEDAISAQITEATSWQAHTARGFFAGPKKRPSIAIEAAERIRQGGPNKQGAKGNYSICRLAEAE
jgi:hypothetical protein